MRLIIQCIYSATPQVVGKWIDGNDIEEATYTIENGIEVNYQTWTTTGIILANATGIIKAYGYGSTGTCQGSLLGDVDTSTHALRLQTTRNGGSPTITYIVVQYIKSST